MDFDRRTAQISTLDDVLSRPECDALLRLAADTGYTAAPITTAVGFVMRPDIRNNTRVILDDPDRARWLWDRLAPTVCRTCPEAVGLNERFRFYRYQPGQFFNWHFDGAYRRNAREWSALTVLVYLDGDCEGGSTDLEGAASVVPKSGRVLVFPHGIRHRGAPVTAGVKHVMRTDVMVRR